MSFIAGSKGRFLLSIIVPFHNSINKCGRLLQTLGSIDRDDVEVVLVDDGSTDGTLEYIAGVRATFKCPSHIISQENRGPGGARNAGLAVAAGDYVWFVDSDDDVDLGCLRVLEELAPNGYDFIDFDVEDRGVGASTMPFSVGHYDVTDEVRHILLECFGRIWTKIFRRDFILKNKIFYPENCVYEDNALLFLYPFVTRRFFKSDFVAYHHYRDSESVTRHKHLNGFFRFNKRFYDRLHTAVIGVERAVEISRDRRCRQLIDRNFVRLFVINTCRLSLFPGRKWLLAMRVMRFYREKAYDLGISLRPFSLLKMSRPHLLVMYPVLWALSYLLPSQGKYFEALHLSAWGKPIVFPRELPL